MKGGSVSKLINQTTFEECAVIYKGVKYFFHGLIFDKEKNEYSYLIDVWDNNGNYVKEPLIYSSAHLRHIFSRLLLAEKLDVHPVHLAFFAIADEKICTESVPPHSISVSFI